MQKISCAFWVLLFLIPFLTILPNKGLAQDVPLEVIKAAEEGLQPFLRKIPKRLIEEYGFDKGDYLEEAYLGRPFNLYKITPDALSNYRTEDTIDSIISETSHWYFPIMLNNSTKTILVVAKVGDNWKAITLGYVPLVRELAEIQQQWPKSKGYNPRLVVVLQAKEYLFTVPEMDAYNLTPIVFKHKTALDNQQKKYGEHSEDGPKYSTLKKLPSVIERLRPIVEQNIKKTQ